MTIVIGRHWPLNDQFLRLHSQIDLIRELDHTLYLVNIFIAGHNLGLISTWEASIICSRILVFKIIVAKDRIVLQLITSILRRVDKLRSFVELLRTDR